MLESEGLKRSLLEVTGSLSPSNVFARQKGLLSDLDLVLEDIRRKFKNTGNPPEALALKAASRFLSGATDLDEVDIDLIAFALAKPVDSVAGNTLFNDEGKLKTLLNKYSAKCFANRDMLITWRGVMGTYFDLNPNNSPDRQQFDRSLEEIRRFLVSTWRFVKSSTELNLSWMKAIDDNIELLSEDPCNRFAQQWLDGNDDLVLKISDNLQIPSSSWFWERLFITSLQSVLNFDDFAFKKSIPKILELFDKHLIYRDRGISALLDRYAICSDISVNKPLKEYVIDLWASPEGHALAGSKWKFISKPALSMMLNWVHETNLRLFFELLKDRGYADDERLNFWLKFIPQVRSSRLSLGHTSQRLVESRSDLKKVFNRHGNSYSQLRDDQNIDNDAFLMTIGSCLIVDFSISGGCYIYREGQNKFLITDKVHYSSTAARGLKAKYHYEGMDFAHTPGWTDQHRAPATLRRVYGITPSSSVNTGTPRNKHPINVRDYFAGSQLAADADQQFKAQTRSELDIPTFVPTTGQAALETRASSMQTELFNYHTAKSSASRVARENGIECIQSGSRFIVRFMRDTGPLAKQFQDLGFTYLTGSGWIIE